jgi:osmotically-inducible protein OsmY
MDIAVDSRQIDVLCNEGIVNNVLTKERAERISKTVKSVRAVVNKIRVLPANIKPEVSGSVVTLRGKVNNLKAKHSAARDARNTVGVLMVKSLIPY